VGADRSSDVLASECADRAGVGDAGADAGAGPVRSNDVLAAAAAGRVGVVAAGRDGTGCGANRSSDESLLEGGAAGAGRCDGAGRRVGAGRDGDAGGRVVDAGGGVAAADDRAPAWALARPATKSAMAELACRTGFDRWRRKVRSGRGLAPSGWR